jgi:hypothetical protein
MQATASFVASAVSVAARAQKSVEHVSLGVPVTAGRVETCAMMSATVCSLLKCERCVFYFFDPMTSSLVYWKSGVAQIVCSLDRGLAGVCARSMVAFKVDYAYLDPNYDPDVDCQHDTPVKSILSCPLTNRLFSLFLIWRLWGCQCVVAHLSRMYHRISDVSTPAGRTLWLASFTPKTNIAACSRGRTSSCCRAWPVSSGKSFATTSCTLGLCAGA